MSYKSFRLQNGKEYMLPENSCAFCEHCTDVFYDYTNGPYAFKCELPNKMCLDVLKTDCKDFVSEFRMKTCEEIKEERRKRHEKFNLEHIRELYRSILEDSRICEIEGWDKLEYIDMIQQVIDYSLEYQLKVTQDEFKRYRERKKE